MGLRRSGCRRIYPRRSLGSIGLRVALATGAGCRLSHDP